MPLHVCEAELLTNKRTNGCARGDERGNRKRRWRHRVVVA